jgi:hypothetical protein
VREGVPCHEGEEFWEVDGAIAVGVHLIDHVLQFGLGGVLPQRAHDCPQFLLYVQRYLGGDGSIAIFVEEGEGLFEFSNLLLVELVGHVQIKLYVTASMQGVYGMFIDRWDS